jgi:hypothetical protein
LELNGKLHKELKMSTCEKNCKYLQLYEDGIKGYETAETSGHCLKHKKMVYFGEDCPDYEAKDNNQIDDG